MSATWEPGHQRSRPRMWRARPLWGSAHRLGLLECSQGSTSSSGAGLLYYAFTERGWIGQAIEAGKWAVACPWEAVHTQGTRFDTSTVLWAPGPGEAVGWWYCSHAHCQRRDLRDVLRLFTPPELHRAEVAAGIATVHQSGLRVTQHRHGIRTIAAQEVTPWHG